MDASIPVIAAFAVAGGAVLFASSGGAIAVVHERHLQVPAAHVSAPISPDSLDEPTIEPVAGVLSSDPGEGFVPAKNAAPMPTLGPAQKAHLSFHSGMRVAIVGDSFVNAGFSQEIRRKFESRGVKFSVDSWVSSTIANWAKSDRLPAKLLEDPDTVIVALGANDVFHREPESLAPAIRSIVAAIGNRSCVWVLPPLWNGETGITWVLKQSLAPCTVYDSSAMQIERQPDGIHPTPKGGADWADAFIAASIGWSDKPEK